MLSELLNEKTIMTDVLCESWQDAAYKASQILVDQNKIKSTFTKKMIDTIMKYGPYVILVPNVAFFHGPPSDDVNEICLSLITLKKPVYFKEFDNQPIKCAFAFGAVDSDSHMKLLQQIVILFQDEAFLELITNNGSKDKILDKINRVKGGFE